MEANHQPTTILKGLFHNKFQPKRHQTQDRTSQSRLRIWKYFQSMSIYGVFAGYFLLVSALDAGGADALFDANRRKPNLKNRVDKAMEQAVIEFAIAFPAHDQLRVSTEFRKQGIFISSSGVRCIWLRRDLPTMKQLLLLEKKFAKDRLILMEAQIQPSNVSSKHAVELKCD